VRKKPKVAELWLAKAVGAAVLATKARFRLYKGW
jgi:hypothetical protein